MNENTLKMIEYLREAADLPDGIFYFPDTLPEHPIVSGFFPFPRLLFPLECEKKVEFADKGEVVSKILNPGDVIVCGGMVWTRELWNTPHRMLSLILFPQYIRFLYLESNGRGTPPPGDTVYYHTRNELPLYFKHLFLSLVNYRSNNASSAELFRILMKIAAEIIQKETDDSKGKEEREWEIVREAFQLHFSENIGREDLASLTGFHPAKISRLLQRFQHTTVREYLNRLRMDYAIRLVNETGFPVIRITEMAGFSFPSYFIRKFREQYRMTPSEYRQTRPVSRRKAE